MAGTRRGGLAAAETNKSKYGPDFYRKIGAKGGRNGHNGGFTGEEGRKRASYYGAIGGSISRRGPAKAKAGDAR